jgi:hypothetical protein
MKNMIRKFLFGDTPITEYATVTVPQSVRERVYLTAGHKTLDLSDRHWLLSLEPVVLGFWILPEDGLSSGDLGQDVSVHFTEMARLDTSTGGIEKLARMKLVFLGMINEDSGTLYLFRLQQTRIFHISPLRSLILYYKYYRKPRLSYAKLKSFAAAYSYPRRVRLISFREEAYYNIFPMDLLGPIPSGNHFVFGLRHTNRSLEKIIRTGRILVSEFPASKKEIIYSLGKHHSSAPPALDQLPFSVRTSEEFGFYFPDWVEAYVEVRIKKTINLGSHMLLWGEWTREKRFSPPAAQLFHIHFLLYLHQLEKRMNYPLV